MTRHLQDRTEEMERIKIRERDTYSDLEDTIMFLLKV